MSKLLKGAAVLAAATLITKILGAVYRIPLVKYIGAEGIGIYQMVFPFYLMLLTVSSSGLPTAISKLVAEGRINSVGFKKALTYFAVLGLFASAVMFLLAKPLAKIQGNDYLLMCYRALAPAVMFVAIIAPIRGCFQGFKIMHPTAISQVLEQVIKVAISLLLIKALAKTPAHGAFLACLSISLSEFFAALFLGLLFIAKKPFKNAKSGAISPLNDNFALKTGQFGGVKDILKLSLPVMLCSIMMPLSRAVDGFLVVRLLSRYTNKAVKLYGLYSGGVESIIAVSTGLVATLSTAALPIIANGKNSGAEKRLIGYAFIFSSLAALFTLLFGGFAIGLLFGGLDGWQQSTMRSLLRIACPTIIGISLMQATTTALISKDKLYFPTLSMLVGVLVKICGILLLVKNPQINIYGNAFCDILCYFVASFFNLIYIISEQKQQKVGAVRAKA